MNKKIGFIGVGKLGLPCAEALAEHYEVEGFDVQTVHPGNFRMVSTIAEACADKDIVFIAVPTPHEAAYGGEAPINHLPPRDFDYSIVKKALGDVSACVSSDQIVVLISTVLPGTTRSELRPLIQNCRFVYNPYLIAMGSVKWDMANPEMLILGTENGSCTSEARRLIQLYRPIMKNEPRIEIGTWEEAECIKLFYNTFISAKISLVNMIQDVSERIGNTNTDVVTKALQKSVLRITGPAYMTAGMGDGGPCHPRDNIALRWLSQKLDLGYDLFGAIMESREQQASNLAKRLIELADEGGLREIWIHGKAYKPLVGYVEGSYSLLVGHFVRLQGRDVHFVDPLTGNKQSSIQGVVLLAHLADVAYGQKPHSTASRLYCEIEAGSIVVDPWRVISKDEVPGCKIVHFGNTREQANKKS